MKVRKPKLYEDEPEPIYQMIGSYGGFSPTPKDDKPVNMRQIGFIRRPQAAKKKLALRK